MRKILDITSDASQEHVVTLQDGEIFLSLRFLSVVQIWTMSIVYKDKTVNGAKLSCGVLHILSKNLPFDFIVVDNSGNEIDPFRVDDFLSDRCSLYIVDPAEMEIIRGVAVEF